MSSETLLILTYVIVLLAWLVVVVMALRNALAARKLNQRVITFTLVFILLSLVCIILSLYFGWKAQNSSPRSPTTTPIDYY